jgi:hypothetical protein
VSVTLDQVVIDTAAAITILDEPTLRRGGLVLGQRLQGHRMIGTGGAVYADSYRLHRVAIDGEIQILGFTPHIGVTHVGHDLGGLLGLDFLELAGAIIDLCKWTIDFAPAVEVGGT